MAWPEDNPRFEVIADDERNPFRATVVGSPDWSSGRIRIEPPVQIGRHVLDGIETDGPYKLAFEASADVEGARATLIEFYDGQVGDPESQYVRESIENTANAIIRAIGGIAHVDLL